MNKPKGLSAERLQKIDKQWGYCSHFGWSRELLSHIDYQAARISELEAALGK